MTVEELMIVAAAVAVASVVLMVCDRIGVLLPIDDDPYSAPPSTRTCGRCGDPVAEDDATVVVDADGSVEWWHETCADRQVDAELEHLARYDGLPRDRGGDE